MQWAKHEPLASILTWDFETNLVDDCLVKVDRASMACSLEVRSPFLDHRVAEFAMKIPPEYKLRNGVHKFILKRAFADLLPEKISSAKSMGLSCHLRNGSRRNRGVLSCWTCWRRIVYAVRASLISAKLFICAINSCGILIAEPFFERLPTASSSVDVVCVPSLVREVHRGKRLAKSWIRLRNQVVDPLQELSCQEVRPPCGSGWMGALGD